MSIFSINNVTVRPTKTMNRANKRARIYETSVPEGKVIHTNLNEMVMCIIDTVKDFLIELDIKPCVCIQR